MKQVLSVYTIKNEIHIGLGIRDTVKDKITSLFRYAWYVKRHCRNGNVLFLPSLFGTNNNFAEARKHNGGTKALEFCNKLDKNKYDMETLIVGSCV